MLANNVDPDAVRKAQKQAKVEDAETFEVIAKEWHAKFTSTWNAGHAETIMSRLERDLKYIDPYMKMITVIGLEGLQTIVFNTVLMFTRSKKLTIKNSKEEALDWLAEQ